MSCTVPRHRLNAIGDTGIASHTKGNLYHKHVMLNIEYYLLQLRLCNGLRAYSYPHSPYRYRYSSAQFILSWIRLNAFSPNSSTGFALSLSHSVYINV